MLLKISKIFLHVSLFSVVIVMTSTFFPFIGGKDYFFRFSVELAAIFLILWWAFEAKEGEAMARLKIIYTPPVFLAVSAFVFIVLLSAAFAYDPHAAFWSNYERGEGGFQMLHYYALFAFLAFTMQKREDWLRLFKTSLVAASLMVLYGVFANLGWADNFISPWQGVTPPSSLWQRLTGPRFQGSLGNPAYVAPYLLFSIFYAAYLFAAGKSRNKLVTGIGYGLLSLAFLFFFVISQTRGAFLGLAAAAFAFFIYLIFSYKSLRRWFAAALAFCVLIFGLLVAGRNSDFVRNLPGGRIFDIAFSEQTVQTRFWTWGSAFKGFLERPILGWGQENFSPVFDKYFDPRHYAGIFKGQNTETWFDRAHSIFFDYLAETGILGLLSYLGIFGAIYWGLFTGRPSARTSSSIENALLFALPLGYLIQGIAIFDVLPMYINLFLVFAFANFYLYNSAAEKYESR